jgi:hypothetical protein
VLEGVSDDRVIEGEYSELAIVSMMRIDLD